jgi:hypothetical protein
MFWQLQALTLADKNDIPRETFLAFVDSFYPAKPIQVSATAKHGSSVGQGWLLKLGDAAEVCMQLGCLHMLLLHGLVGQAECQ